LQGILSDEMPLQLPYSGNNAGVRLDYPVKSDNDKMEALFIFFIITSPLRIDLTLDVGDLRVGKNLEP
jgi:hypothetical protein